MDEFVGVSLSGNQHITGIPRVKIKSPNTLQKGIQLNLQVSQSQQTNILNTLQRNHHENTSYGKCKQGEVHRGYLNKQGNTIVNYVYQFPWDFFLEEPNLSKEMPKNTRKTPHH